MKRSCIKVPQIHLILLCRPTYLKNLGRKRVQNGSNPYKTNGKRPNELSANILFLYEHSFFVRTKKVSHIGIPYIGIPYIGILYIVIPYIEDSLYMDSLYTGIGDSLYRDSLYRGFNYRESLYRGFLHVSSTVP